MTQNIIYKLMKNFIPVLSFSVFIFFCYARIFREFLWTASTNNMANGDYVFITLELFPSDWLGYYMKYIKSKCLLFLSNNYFNTHDFVCGWRGREGREHQCLSVHYLKYCWIGHKQNKTKKQTKVKMYSFFISFQFSIELVLKENEVPKWCKCLSQL